MEKLRVNPWYLVFVVIGVAILHALHDLIYTVATRNVYIIKEPDYSDPGVDAPEGEIVEGKFERHDEYPGNVTMPIDNDEKHGNAKAADIVDTPRVRRARNKAKGGDPNVSGGLNPAETQSENTP